MKVGNENTRPLKSSTNIPHAQLEFSKLSASSQEANQCRHKTSTTYEDLVQRGNADRSDATESLEALGSPRLSPDTTLLPLPPIRNTPPRQQEAN